MHRPSVVHAALVVLAAVLVATAALGATAAVAPEPAQAAGYVHLQTWGGPGSSDGRATWPLFLWADSKGSVWVADYFNDRVQRFTSDGAFMSAFGSSGAGDGQFARPTGICYDEARQVVYVADSYNSRIQKFTRYGTYLSQWGSAGTGDGQFNNPHGVAVDADGNVYVADTGNHRVQVFQPDGTFIRKFGGPGSGEGQMSTPTGIVVDDGTCFVSEVNNHRIQAFDLAGTFLRAFGSYGNGDGQLANPYQLSLDKAGNLLVCEWGNNRISRFTQAGAFMDSFGGTGTQLDGQFSAPEGVAGDGEGHIYVADLATSRIQKFAWDDTPPHIIDDYAGDWFADGATIRYWATDDYSRTITWSIFGMTADVPVGEEITTAAFMGPPPFVGTLAQDVTATDEVGNTSTRTVYYRVDTMPPVTRVSGVPTGWTNQDVTLDFIATDKGSGVAGTTCDAGGTWATVGGDDVVTVSAEGETTVQYYSWDAAVPAANQEATKSVVVRIDKTAPTPVAPLAAVTVRRGRSATFKFAAADALSPTLTGKLTIRKKTKVVKTYSLAAFAPGTSLAKKLRVSLPAGVYTWSLRATDLAGNTTVATVWKKLTVKP